MDFASLMAKEISKSKNIPVSTSSSATDKKYLKRSETEAARVAAYNAEQDRLQKDREERAERKRKLEAEEADRNREREDKRRRLAEESKRRREIEVEAKEKERRKRLGLPEAVPRCADGSKDNTPSDGLPDDIDDDELIKKLRALGEPARLFGESHRGRLKRYRRLEQRSLTPQPQLLDGPIPTTLQLVPEAEMKVPSKLPTDAEGRELVFRQLASYFTMVLKEWEIALENRDQSVKQSYQGKQAYNAMVQSRENMRPLFKKFEQGDLEDGILGPVLDIVRNAQERRYVSANDGYLKLSIGNA
jgi:pre-mRNA-splicing factor 18